MIAPDTTSEAGPEWDEAFLRVESYLRAHRVESRLLLNRLASEIVTHARAQQPLHPGKDAVALAMHLAEQRLDAWFQSVLGPPEGSGEAHFGARGRLAVLMADVPTRWPAHFLSEQPPPPELIEAMRTSYLAAGPELAFSNMAPRPLDLGPVASVAGETWRTFRRLPLLRSLVGWGLLIAAFVAAWMLTR